MDEKKSEADVIPEEVIALNMRWKELMSEGRSSSEAHQRASLELRISQWPPEWGNYLHVFIYGDFEPPEQDLEYPSLGITIESAKITNSIIRSAFCVLRARVTVSERSISGAQNAMERVSKFLGVWTLIDWGNRGIGCWSWIVGNSMVSVGAAFKLEGIQRALHGIEKLRPDIQHQIGAALYWIRDPKALLQDQYKSDTLRMYVGYWNAFECLVEAVCMLAPQTNMSTKDKVAGINKFLADHQGAMDITKFTECYRTYVDPGFVAKASHALRILFPESAGGYSCKGYIDECFRMKPKNQRLYDVRNAINHGTIATEDFNELSRVDDRLNRLSLMVLGMFGRLIRFRYPLDRGPK